MNGLRDYQSELYVKARNVLMRVWRVCVQSATGSGKTPLVSAMVESVHNKKKRAWFIVPRKELLTQASNHFRKWQVPHGIISPNSNESRAYKIHVVSKDTLIRRYDKIKNWPDLIIFDECHLYLDRQKEIISHLPESSKIIGITATPERLDGRGLSEIYNELIEGPSIPWLTERHFLTELRYFSPPIEGLANLHVRGTDYDEEELEELFKRQKIYGELVGHYEKWGKGKPALIFCRSVKSAYQTAERFRDKGFNFHCIEGKMSDKKRQELIQALTQGNIDGLTNCEIATYGLDIPRVEYGASIRPTLSRALYMQIIGRILRPWEDKETGYKKEEALFFDHVNLILEHQDDDYPGMPLHFVPHISWNFDGTEKRKKDKCPKCAHLKENDYCEVLKERLLSYKTVCKHFVNDRNIRLCPMLDYFYCNKPSCHVCPHNPDDKVQDVRQAMVVIPANLKEIERPKGLTERPPKEQREYQDRINNLILDYKAEEAPGPVEELLKIAEELGYAPLWIYWKLVDKERKSIHVPLLHEICRVKGYKSGWVWFKIKELRAKGYADYEKKETQDVWTW